MSEPAVAACIDRLLARAVPTGGFAARPDSGYRADATAWAVLALTAAGGFPDLMATSAARLAQDQLPDGRVCISPGHPEAFWPTPLAVLAWCSAEAQPEARSRAVRFLLSTTGKQFPWRPDAPVAHDPDIKGWPWIQGTHSWVGSTSITIMALGAAGAGTDDRVAEAVRLLLNRQLRTGGWNYGNKIVFGVELRPMPESTGMALSALSTRTTKESLRPSLDYLKSALAALRTPYSLGWSLMGLGAWDEAPPAGRSFLTACLERKELYEAYDTTSLALLLLALVSPRGLAGGFERSWRLSRA